MSVNKSSTPKKLTRKEIEYINTRNLAAAITLSILFVAVFITFTVIFVIKNRDNAAFANEYSNQTRVGYETEYLGFVDRKIPTEIQDEGLACGYPTYGYTKSYTMDEKLQVIAEASYLCATPTRNASGTFDKMDSEGNLYLNGTPLNRKLYKHTSSVGMYLGDVSNEERGVIKRITMSPRGYNSYSVTGLYAPAGEVIKVQISEADMKATNGIQIHIGQCLYNGQANNIWEARNINRMPVILNTMNINTATATLEDGVYTAYIGSYFGGPVYVVNEGVDFSVVISGAVNYSHFILGYTTKEEFESNAKSTAPFFDLEVWEYGVLHSGPKYYAAAFDFDQIYEAAVLWEKISLVSTQVTNQGVVFLYDPFVAAGAAVAFPGRSSVNCPMGWMPNSLNYNTFVRSGAWGNMHEYNHNFQSGWGRGAGGEVTNNALNLVSYSLFTKISSSRTLGASGDALGGWNRYTSATWALRQTLSRTENPLREYATLLHSYGQEKFLQAIRLQRAGRYGQSYSGYYRAVTEATHNNMTYFFNEILGAGLPEESINQFRDSGYPMYVPISSIYQTGQSFNYDNEKQYIETMQPYRIKYGANFTIDLSAYKTTNGDLNGMYVGGSVILPSGFSYRIKSITQPKHGKITKTEENIYTFTPDKSNLRSGKIYVTIEITKDDHAFEVDDVDLVLEFEQDHEINKTMLQRTVYTYSDENKYTDPVTAYESGYAGYSSKEETDNINPVQNGNAEVWYTTPPAINSIVEIRGKLLASEAGKYRIALRGRHYAALYVSLDNGNSYDLAVNLKNESNFNGFNMNDPSTYQDLKDIKAGQWIYFKALFIVDYKSAFIGVGWGRFEPPSGYFDEEGNYIGSSEETISVNYASAYRSTYEIINKKFETDYFLVRNYSQNFTNTENFSLNQKVVSSPNYNPWDESFDINNLFDGNKDTNIHTKNFVSANSPFELVVDAGKEIKANRMTLYGYTKASSVQNSALPVTFDLFGSLDGENFDMLIGSFTNLSVNNINLTVSFEEKSFRYYKLIVTKTNTSRYLALNSIDFSHYLSLQNGEKYSPDNAKFEFKGRWTIKSTKSTFGHVYQGDKNANVIFEFTGRRIGILSSANLKGNFEVWVDGYIVDSISLAETNGTSVMSYLSKELKDGHHKVRIFCKSMATIDSIITW